ncbi:SDR family oxidoreductase [Paenibacillus amylolyticus]|uniref:NmrA family protein n=1 Tax=Paenibacillus amylolyticus TaxID=1451 RepID=A0A100VL64_PAEAM|nr:SDR family oxidoreductase [Paenibacillus amylolyticus]GAS81880.1 NmrA family protein [Paenibacillus amylolyticus]
MSTLKENNVLVTGASGNVGRLVVDWLLENYNGSIIATTRHPEKLADLAERGVIVRHADFDQPESLDEAFAGAQRLLLISTDAIGIADIRLNQQTQAVRAAVKAGVNHIVYTSFFNNEPGTANVTAADHYFTEQAIKDSGLTYTILRNNLYAENLLQALEQAAERGMYASAIGEGKISYIARQDCAIAAAVAVSSSNNDNKTLNLTGLEAVSGQDIARILSEAVGNPVSYVPLEIPQLVGIYESFHMPKPMAEALASFDAASAKGEYELVTQDFKELTGQNPISIKQFLAAQKNG